MAPYSDDDWSDSDEELEGVETSVLLGVPDVPVDAESDLNDAAVSRIGGKPAFLSSAIPFESSQCSHCKNPMELLVQLWCPLEDSAYDRAMYVWGCARATCQRQPGTVRAWRGLRYNEEYASKLAKKRAKPAAKPDERSETSADRPKVNPFAMTGDSGSAAALGLGSDLFGASPVFEGANHGADDPETVEDDGDDSSDDSSVESVVVALASATLADSPWKSAPSYPPLYLSTLVEYVEPEKSKVKATQVDISMDEASEAQNNWPAEKYENSLETDHVFDRFSQRISTEPHQCVRYDLYGIPLPFCTDETYKRLFPLSDGDPTVNIVTRSAFAATSKDASRRTYDPRTLPTCPVCGENRVFECQLMPNLINVAKDDTKNTSPDSNGDHRQELESLLAGKGVHSRGMEWGTILVFTCEKDCCPSRDIGWHEEHVLVQWDS